VTVISSATTAAAVIDTAASVAICRVYHCNFLSSLGYGLSKRHQVHYAYHYH
jgi:hypothetical protein